MFGEPRCLDERASQRVTRELRTQRGHCLALPHTQHAHRFGRDHLLQRPITEWLVVDEHDAVSDGNRGHLVCAADGVYHVSLLVQFEGEAVVLGVGGSTNDGDARQLKSRACLLVPLQRHLFQQKVD